MSKFTSIFKSRFKDKEDFYFERLETCLSCDKWSLNSGESKGALYELASFGKGHCTICGCGEHKLRMPEEKCPIGKWKAEGNEVKQEQKKIEVDIISKELVSLSYEDDIPTLDYGIIKEKSNSAINIQLITDKYETYNLKSSCGCTVPKLKENEKGYILNISYDTKRLGNFNKTVNITFISTKPKLSRENFAIKIKGTVTNKL